MFGSLNHQIFSLSFSFYSQLFLEIIAHRVLRLDNGLAHDSGDDHTSFLL